MKPLMYGYLRATVAPGDEEAERLERRLHELAEQEGFCFAATFRENRPGERGALSELTAELRRAEARHVVVPSLEHISRHPRVRDELLEQLREEVGAHVWTADRTVSPVCRL
ncbi:recombinase family protein [Antribacter sp. KLBMP9083]|uniref:Recombinase family protein n=1 Tax=Antribacter soli TaxID=2910976 RepID=A0AA41QAK9_9MICO|nr:recombinase family protein [Antribacter soli]MCF4119576.1 recombinase family protein [Antribacter soli]